MAHSVLVVAAELLRQHYGQPPQPVPRGEWMTLVRIVLERDGSAGKGRDWSRLDETPLTSPEETVRLAASRVAEILKTAGLEGRRSGALPALAQWWLDQVAGEETSVDFSRRPLETWQAELRAIRGVSWELADRILLCVGGLAVYPLDRGSLRVAARHGWMDLTAEYDDWRAFFIGGLHDSAIDLANVSYWNMRAGREFCGARPKCDECPLKELLPERGPVPIDSED
jgi:endonuclease-3 related protein